MTTTIQTDRPCAVTTHPARRRSAAGAAPSPRQAPAAPSFPYTGYGGPTLLQLWLQDERPAWTPPARIVRPCGYHRCGTIVLGDTDLDADQRLLEHRVAHHPAMFAHHPAMFA